MRSRGGDSSGYAGGGDGGFESVPRGRARADSQQGDGADADCEGGDAAGVCSVPAVHAGILAYGESEAGCA